MTGLLIEYRVCHSDFWNREYRSTIIECLNSIQITAQMTYHHLQYSITVFQSECVSDIYLLLTKLATLESISTFCLPVARLWRHGKEWNAFFPSLSLKTKNYWTLPNAWNESCLYLNIIRTTPKRFIWLAHPAREGENTCVKSTV